MPADERRVAAIVLAAGSSRRTAPVNKLLAPVGGEAMVRRVAGSVLASRARPVLVVTGHQAQEVRKALSGLHLHFVHNEAHALGIGASVARGIRALPGKIDAAVIVLGDMPAVGAGVIDALIDAFADAATVDACVPVHDGRRGNPVLWSARHFPALTRLDRDRGARTLLEQLPDVTEVPVAAEGVLRDVDTAADLEAAGGGAGW